MDQPLTRDAPEGITNIVITPTGSIIRIVKHGNVRSESTISERIYLSRNSKIIRDLRKTPDGELKVELYRVFAELRRSEKKGHDRDMKKIDRLTNLQGILHSQVNIDEFNAVLHKYNIDTSAFDLVAEFKVEPGSNYEPGFNNILAKLRSEPDGENKSLLFKLLFTIRGTDTRRKTNTNTKISRNKILRDSLMKRVNIPELVEFLRANKIREKALKDFGLIE